MNEQDIELLLTRWYTQDADPGKPAPQALRARVLSVPLAYPRAGATHTGRLVLIAAVALLGTMLLALAVAMGGQLFRLPSAVVTPSPDPTTTASPSLGPAGGPSVETEPLPACAAKPDEGVLLTLRQDEGADSIATQTIVFVDGRVVEGSLAQLELGDQWRQRRLSEVGVARLLDVVGGAQLPNCLRATAGTDTSLVVDRPGAAPLAVSVGVWDFHSLRQPTGDEKVRLAELLAQLDDLDGWLEGEDWLDAEWLPYGPRWQVWIDIDPGPYSACRNPNYDDVCIPPGDGVLLPGGTDLITFGDLYPAQDYPYAYRCGEVSALEAEEIVSTLDLVTDDDHDAKSREYVVDRELLTISVRSFLPHETACERELGWQAPEAPPDALAELDPCAYLPRTLPQVLFHNGTHGLRTEDWAWCYLWLEHGEIDVHLRARPTTAEDAAAYVASLFGEEGLLTEASGEAVLYTNACSRGEANCRPAIAISAEPYLFVIAEISGDMLDELRPVAEAIRIYLAGMDDAP